MLFGVGVSILIENIKHMPLMIGWQCSGVDIHIVRDIPDVWIACLKLYTFTYYYIKNFTNNLKS